MGLNRRDWLSGVGVALLVSPLAGCLEQDTSIEAPSIPRIDPDAPPADYVLNLTPVNDVEIAIFHMRQLLPHHEGIVEQIEAGDGTAVIADQSPIQREEPFYYDGTIYTFEHEEVGTTSGLMVRFWLEFDSAAGAFDEVPAENHYSSEELPEVDRTDLIDRHGLTGDDYFEQAWVSNTYVGDEIEASAFVPDPEPVAIELEDGWVKLDPDEPEELELTRFEYSLEVYEDSPASIGQELREEYEFELTGYDDEEAELLREAIDEEYGYRLLEEEPPEAFYRLVDRFEAAENLPIWYGSDEEDSNQYIVAFDGGTYWASIHYREE